MEQMPPVRRSGARRTSQRSQQPMRQESRKKKSRVSIILALIAFAAVIGLIVLVSPKEPISRATYTSGTADGHVAAANGGVSAAYQGLRISEMMPSNRTAVPDENGSYSDWVEVWNSSDAPINLKDVGLSDRSDSIRFLFPDMTLQPDQRVVVFCSDTNAAEVGRPFHAKFKLSSVGETVYLYDPNAYLIDSATNPIMASDESWALMDGTYAATALFSPGYENSEAGYQAYQHDTMATGGALIINEIMADAVTGLTDEDGELSDWIELHNTTDYAISLDNYALSDKENKPLQWRFPQGAVVAPHGYYVVFCSGKDRA
ncbi:MAG: lamin tail domain-containing protein, partial [Clostridia bacterium]|nr:lamin tail domain-containing protein [Clostridia bacterium]